jgi:hypothetical protein
MINGVAMVMLPLFWARTLAHSGLDKGGLIFWNRNVVKAMP